MGYMDYLRLRFCGIYYIFVPLYLYVSSYQATVDSEPYWQLHRSDAIA